MSARWRNSDCDSATASKISNEPPRSEKEFSRYRADKAKLALRKTFQRTIGHVFSLIDPRVLTRRHPLGATGAAVAGGFLIATRSKTVPKEKRRAKDTRPEVPASPANPTLLGILVTAGAEIIKNAVTPILADHLHERMKDKKRE